MVKVRSIVLILGVLAVTAAHTLEPGDRVDNFRLLDHRGESHELYYHSDASAIVVMVQGNGCPIVRNQLPRLAEIRDAYAEKGVEFFLINSNLHDDRDRIRTEASEFSIDFPILMDSGQLIGESMGFTRTAEVFVINPNRWQLAYRGPIDDRVSYQAQRPTATRDYLTDALDAVLAGEAVSQAEVEAEGCLVHFPERDQRAKQTPSYSEDIAPLIADNCVACHRPGGIGPFAMSEYAIVHGFAPMIREVLRTDRMPPWHADPHHGEFSNDRSLTTAERQKLVRWVEAGAPRGEGEDPLPALTARDWPEWELGEPDLIIELPPFDVPATGVIAYQHPRIPNPLKEGVWVRAVDFEPGDRAVVHHIIATFAGQEGRHQREGALGSALGGFVPGGGPTRYPEGTGVFLEPDAIFVLQMHYTTMGRATTDVTRMALYFADEPPERELRNLVLINPRISIPPHTRKHTEQATHTFEHDVWVHSLLPHAHYRGRSSAFIAVHADGSEETLLSVPNYDFNWQHDYVLAEPVFLPAGTKLIHRTSWDNSVQNRANPDPSVEVRWGLQSWDEMLFGSVRYTRADTAAETARVTRPGNASGH